MAAQVYWYDGRDGWEHEDDGTPRCPEGLAQAVRVATAILSHRAVRP